MAKQPAVTPHGDPNVMVSPISAFFRLHLFAEFGALAVFIIVELICSSMNFGTWFEWVLCVVCTVLWIAFDFYSTLNAGMRDHNLVKYNYIQYDKWKGLKSGLLAQIPGVIVIVLLWITNISAGRLNEWMRLFYFILYAPTSKLTTWMVDYVGEAMWIFPIWICPAVSTLAYYLGYHEIPFLTKLVYKNRARSKKLR